MSEEGIVKVDYDDVENHVGDYTRAAFLLQPRYSLSAGKSTIQAKGNAEFSYRTSQTVLGSLGVGLDNEAAVIRETGATFKEYDEMLANMEGEGFRFQVIGPNPNPD